MGGWPVFLFLVSCGHCGGPENSPATGETSRLSTSGSDFFGINEAVSIPKAWIDRGLIEPGDEAEALALDAQLSRNLGASIVRGNSPVYPYLDHQSLAARDWDWTRSDKWVRAVQEAGLEALLVIGPWPGNRTGAFTQTYLPPDLEAYDEYLRRVVERYDGDGIDDMPDLKASVRYWEVDNEPDLHNSVPAKGAPRPPDPASFETPEEYAEILIRSSRVIHETHPDPVVLSAGLFRPHHPKGKSYLESVLSVSGAPEAIDVLSLHCYFDQDSLETVARTMQNASELLPGVPVWITETGVPSMGKASHIDPVWQAKMVAGVYGAFLAAGADRVFWHTLADPPNAKQHMKRAPFASHSLLQSQAPSSSGSDSPPLEKPAGTVYRNLAHRMAHVTPSSIHEVEVDGGRLLRTDQGWLAFWGSPALPLDAGAVHSLISGEEIEVSGTVSAPAWIEWSQRDP